jgi:hypothetical protein
MLQRLTFNPQITKKIVTDVAIVFQFKFQLSNIF